MEETQLQSGATTEAYADSMTRVERWVKRAIDILVASCCLIVLSPIILLVYLLILFFGGGLKSGVIYHQERVGYKGKPFTIYKFRTMRKNAERNGILRTEEERKREMTRVGHFLCVYHLDELPQFFNVLIGDMSLVGPRPERQFFIDQIMLVNPNYVHIYKMRPGLTSMATLYNGYTDTMEKMLIRLNMDLEYLTTRTLWGDFLIVCKTALYLLSGRRF